MDKDEKQEAIEALLGDSPVRFCSAWLEALEQAGEEEKEWRTKKAEEANKAYKGEGDGASFNIFHSNVETLVPALYNSSPIPDVRRRFNDDDLVAQGVSETIERAINFSIDDYDFDDTMKGVVKDMTVVDRGVAWAKYTPTFGPDGVEIVYEEVLCELVEWAQFRRGPAKTWSKVPWVARAHFLDKKEVERLVTMRQNVMQYDDELVARITQDIKYNYTPNSSGDQTRDASLQTPKFGRREMVWEIWDKDTRQVIWLSQDYGDYPLAILEDPLELKNFFPTPRPAMVITSTDSLVPITSFEIYSDLIDQLNNISVRIDALVDQIRVRGGYAGVQDEIELIGKAGDGELVALNNAEIFATAGGGLDKAILWWPLEMIYKALEVLVAQREIVKQTIYEVTGLADIVRGATDPGETATAQQLKEKWGSIRVQSHQKEVERYARDLFRLKAEIMCKHFQMDTLFAMTGLRYPYKADQERAAQVKQMGEQMLAEFQQQGGDASQLPPELQKVQAEIEEILGKPTVEDMEAMMRDSRVLRYRVDVESDSTVRADLSKNQEQMKGFLDGTAAYASSMGPMVQEGIMDPETAVVIYAAFARNFRLGKTAEDTLEKWIDRIKKQGVQGKPPDPTVQAEADKKIAETEKIRTETQLLPRQQNLEEAKARSEVVFKARQAENADNALAADFEFKKRTTSEDIKDRRADRGLKHRELNDRTRQAEADREERKSIHADGHRLERLKLSDSRQARREGYEAGQVPNEQGVKPPLPEIAPLEEGELTREEMQRLEQNTQAMQGVQQGLEAIAQAQAQQGEALMQALQALTQALTAPKEVVRDQTGKAVGVRPAATV